MRQKDLSLTPENTENRQGEPKVCASRVSNPQGPKFEVRAIPCMGHINVNVKSDPSQTVAGP
jgi:hypothetical protein